MRDGSGDWRSLAGASVTTRVPTDWIDVPGDALPPLGPARRRPDAIATAPDVASGRFRPNVVITSAPSDEPIEALSLSLIAETLGIDGWSRVLAVDVWPAAGAAARRQESCYVLGGTAVAVTTYLIASGGRRLDVTFSRGLEDVAHLRGVGDGIGAAIAVLAGVDA